MSFCDKCKKQFPLNDLKPSYFNDVENQSCHGKVYELCDKCHIEMGVVIAKAALAWIQEKP